MPNEHVINELKSIRTVDLTTTGRRTGRASRVEIWWFYIGDRFVITGTPGKRDWYANVLSDSKVVIHTTVGDFEARALTIHDRAFRRRVFTDPEVEWARTQVDLERLVADAPMIEIRLD